MTNVRHFTSQLIGDVLTWPRFLILEDSADVNTVDNDESTVLRHPTVRYTKYNKLPDIALLLLCFSAKIGRGY